MDTKTVRRHSQKLTETYKTYKSVLKMLLIIIIKLAIIESTNPDDIIRDIAFFWLFGRSSSGDI